MNTTTRNATLADLATMLQEQQARRFDVVAPASKISARNGQLVIQGTEPELTDDGVTMTEGTYVPTMVADEGIAAKLNIPLAYLRRMREDRADLYDANVNAWLHGRSAQQEWVPQADGRYAPIQTAPEVPGDPRKFLVRCFTPTDGESTGIARAFLSDSYRVIDNLDVLMATLDGVKDAGLQVTVHSCDLTERRMHVRLHAPQIAAMAPVLLAGYRSPFNGQSGDELPVVYAGLRISNSEVGGGAFTIVPELRVQICSNGMTMTADAQRNVHLGGKLEEGMVQWSSETQRRAVELVQSKTTDAVRTFLSPEYLTDAIARLERRAAEPVSTQEVQVLAKGAGVSQADIDGMLDFFVRGGQLTRAGVANALTAYSQGVSDGDAAAELDAAAASLLLA